VSDELAAAGALQFNPCDVLNIVFQGRHAGYGVRRFAVSEVEDFADFDFLMRHVRFSLADD